MAVIETLSTFKAKTSASFVRLSFFLQNFNAKSSASHVGSNFSIHLEIS